VFPTDKCFNNADVIFSLVIKFCRLGQGSGAREDMATRVGAVAGGPGGNWTVDWQHGVLGEARNHAQRSTTPSKGLVHLSNYADHPLWLYMLYSTVWIFPFHAG
jgi:hypothetical protein